MTLSACPLRTPCRIVDVDVDDRYRLRLKELGLRPGALFTATNRAAFGGVVVNIAGTRVAVDHASTKRIIVESLSK